MIQCFNFFLVKKFKYNMMLKIFNDFIATGDRGPGDREAIENTVKLKIFNFSFDISMKYE